MSTHRDPRGRFFWLFPLITYMVVIKLLQRLPEPWPSWGGIALLLAGAVAMTVLLVRKQLSPLVWLLSLGLLSIAAVSSLDVPWKESAIVPLACCSALLLLIVVARNKGAPAGE